MTIEDDPLSPYFSPEEIAGLTPGERRFLISLEKELENKDKPKRKLTGEERLLRDIFKTGSTKQKRKLK